MPGATSMRTGMRVPPRARNLRRASRAASSVAYGRFALPSALFAVEMEET